MDHGRGLEHKTKENNKEIIMKYVYEVEYESKRDYNYTKVARFESESEAIAHARQLNEWRIGEDAKNSDIIVTKLELDDDGDIDSCWGTVWSADEEEASRKENRVVVTVDRQCKTGDAWVEDYATLDEALKAAQTDWDYLTKAEQKKNVIYVYVDEILQEEDEEHDEDRRSWHDGFTPIETFGGYEQ